MIATWILACVISAMALAMLWVKDLMRMLYLLAGVLLGIAAVFASLQADFLASAQIIIYIGGVLILLLFGVMMSKRGPDGKGLSETWNKPFGVLITLVLVLAIAGKASALFFKHAPEKQATSIKDLGVLLAGPYWLSLETIGLFLFVAILGSLWFAARK